MRAESLLTTNSRIGDPRMLSDDDLLCRLADLLRQSRRIEWQLVAHIGEVDHRRLYAREAAESMFAYCTNVLHLSEHEAYLRITVARAARDHPALLEMLADGRLHLTGIAKLLPHLTPLNRDRVLARAVHKTKEQICELIAELAPRPDAPELIRRLPVPPTSAPAPKPTAATASDTGQIGPDRVPSSAPARPGRVEPLAPKRYLVQFTASAEFHEKLQRLTALMRTVIPDGELALILEQAVSEKLERLEARRFGRTGRPRKTIEQCDTSPSTSRCIPAPVRRGVDGRDDRRCRFVDAQGRRCQARARLELHHDRAHARGGDRSMENIQLMCRTHNLYLAEQEFGKAHMARYRRGADT